MHDLKVGQTFYIGYNPDEEACLVRSVDKGVVTFYVAGKDSRVGSFLLGSMMHQLMRFQKHDPSDDAELYRELISAVERKFPGETRHQTALRYIREAEERVAEGECKKDG